MKNSLKAAFKLSLPVLMGYLFLGITYGVLAHSLGFSIWYPLSMAIFVFSGAAEFLALGMLLANFNPINAATVSLVVGARHLFYGISMLERYNNVGWRKPFLIFGLTDETFAINFNTKNATPNEMLLVSLLNYSYWITGGVLGYCFKSFIPIDIRGLEFVVTAMFVSIFMDQFLKEKERRPAYIGIICSLISLILLGPQYFILLSMILILASLYLLKNSITLK